MNQKENLLNICKKMYVYKLAFYLFSFKGLGLAKYSIVRSFLDHIMPYFRLEFIETDGNKIFLDKNDSLNLSLNPTYEKSETNFIKKQIKNGDVIIDVGANIGYYTVLFAKLVGKTGKVFAFEPESKNFAILKKNIDVNNYRNVIINQKAVSNKTGTIRLYLCNYNSGMHRIYDSVFCGDYVEIESIQLDNYDFMEVKNKIQFIKIDVEGSEYEVLQGMKSILINNPNVKIMLEYAPFSLQESGCEPKKILLFLKNLGFNFYEIDLEGKTSEISMDLLTKKYPAEKKNYINLVCAKNIDNN